MAQGTLTHFDFPTYRRPPLNLPGAGADQSGEPGGRRMSVIEILGWVLFGGLALYAIADGMRRSVDSAYARRRRHADGYGGGDGGYVTATGDSHGNDRPDHGSWWWFGGGTGGGCDANSSCDAGGDGGGGGGGGD